MVRNEVPQLDAKEMNTRVKGNYTPGPGKDNRVHFCEQTPGKLTTCRQVAELV